MALSGFFFAFLPVLSHLLSEQRVFLPVKTFVPKEVTLGCAPAPELNFWVALIQFPGENHSTTLSYGSLYDHYLSFKHLHLQLLVCADKIHHHGFNSPKVSPRGCSLWQCQRKEVRSQVAREHKLWLARSRSWQTPGIWRGEEIQDNVLVQQINLPAFFLQM